MASPAPLIALLTGLLVSRAAPALAQLPFQPLPPPDRWGLTAALGASVNGDQNQPHTGLDLALSLRIPLPVVPRLSAVAEFGTVGWRFDAFGAREEPRVDRVGLRRLVVGVVRRKRDMPAFYAGGGVGWYRYRARIGTLAIPGRFGLHGRAGVEIPLPDRPLAVLGEVQVHAVRGPNRTGDVDDSPVFSHTMWVGSASAGIRFNFK